MTVITGTDGTEGADRAVVVAARVAFAMGEPLVIVCAHRDVEAERVGPAGDENYLAPSAHAQLVAENAAKAATAAYPELEVRTRAEEGKPVDVILSLAEELDATLIVVGNRRVQGISRVLGSIASDISRQAPCDVYIAHTQA